MSSFRVVSLKWCAWKTGKVATCGQGILIFAHPSFYPIALDSGIIPVIVSDFYFFGEDNFDIIAVSSVGFHIEILFLPDKVTVLGIGHPGLTF